MPHFPLVSAIIPTYNRAKYISEAVKSVLEQERSGYEVEVIVVDDGSTDETQAVLREFGDRIVTRRIENSGRPAVPRNVGIGLARGELIAFQDSDDRWVADKLKRQVGVFADPEVMVAYGNASTMSAEGVVNEAVVVPTEDLKGGWVFEDLLVSNFVSTLTTMVRREMFDRVGMFDEARSLSGIEDYQLWLRMAVVGKFAAVPEALAHYRTHEGNISNVPEATGYRRLIDTLESLTGVPMTARQRRMWHDRLSGLYGVSAKITSDGRWKYAVDGLRHRVAAKYYGLMTRRERA